MSTIDRRPGNHLLALLPEPEIRRLRQHLTRVPLPARRILQRQGEPVDEVFFPNDGIVSIATRLSDGSFVEAATIGAEGVVGVDALFGNGVAPYVATVQVTAPAASAEMMGAADFRHELSSRGPLHVAVTRYAQVFCAELMRSTACNARHDVAERFAKWLLTVSDQMSGRDFHLSQELLAAMLGVRRQAVSAVATTLRAAGIISYRHGDIRILDRRRLEAVACECYPAIAALTGALTV